MAQTGPRTGPFSRGICRCGPIGPILEGRETGRRSSHSVVGRPTAERSTKQWNCYPITLGRLEGQGRRGKPLTADYVLKYRNTKLGVIEAKAEDEELTEGVAQAKNYAGKLSIQFTYSSNSRGIYGIDMKEGTEGELPAFPTPDELWNLTFAETNASRDRFAAVPFEDRGGYFQPRYYQDIAISRSLEAIAAGVECIPVFASRRQHSPVRYAVRYRAFAHRNQRLSLPASTFPFGC